MKPLLCKLNTKNMTDCSLCKKPLNAGQNNGSRHNICDNEAKSRVSRGICAWCGKNPKGKYNIAKCASCIEFDAEMHNYPGP